MNITDFKGSWVDGRYWSSALSFSVHNPSNAQELGQLSLFTQKEIEEAIQIASQQQQYWQQLSPYQRSNVLEKMADLMEVHLEDLATIISLENGKPLMESKGEVTYAISFFRWYAEEGKRIYGQIIPSHIPNLTIEKHYRPIGLCAFITPWNFPLAMLAKKIPPALAAGCSIICKPAEETPYSALALAQISKWAGLPDGVFNVVLGNPVEIGQIFCQSPLIRKLSFTGSTPVGKILMQQAAHNLQKLSLELGGNAPFIVCESANISKALEGAIHSKFRNSGQACISSNRFLIHESIADVFIEELKNALSQLTVGDAFEKDSDIGPLISDKAVQKVCHLFDDAIAKGAILLFGEQPSPTQSFVQPCILTNIQTNMALWSEEIFGPMIAITTFKSTEEALNLANLSAHGLGSYLYSEEHSEIQRFKMALQCGMIGINTGKISMAQAPFGGIKHSGFGREGGADGILEYLTVHSIFEQY